ncbi:MAG: aldo/keto reductase [Deltaproteobacteria bacterium]|nr:aldo/keto reductase [Deltaproteobacteria bacterium]
MEKRKFGNTDMYVSVLGFGGSEIGYEGTTPRDAETLLNEGLDAGINVIDTAECYVTSEQLIGGAIGHRRKEYFLFTKCGHERGWSNPDWRPESLLRSIERSLKRLKTDCVDLVQLHSCSETELRNGAVIEALKQAKSRGHTRYIGYSGDGRAALYAIDCGAFDTLQTSVSIAEQEAVESTLPRARERNLGVIAKRPLANVAWHNGSHAPDNSYGYTYWTRLQKLQYDFLTGDLSASVATALRFTLTVPGVHTAIVGTGKVGRFRENTASIKAGRLPDELYENIRERWRRAVQRSWTAQT